MILLLDALLALTGLVVAPLFLCATRAFDRHPRWGVAAWMSCATWGWGGLFLLLLQLALPSAGGAVPAMEKLLRSLTSGHPLANVGCLCVIALSIAGDIALLLGGGLILGALRTAISRRRQRATIDLVGAKVHDLGGVHTIATSQPIAYFVPGAGGRIVVSDGARAALSNDEMAAVIAHERGHRDAHHGGFMTSLSALSPFISFLPLAALAPRAVRTYLEMDADDHARRHVDHQFIARALEKSRYFASSPHCAIALGPVGLERRLARLQHAIPARRDWRAALTLVTTTGLVVLVGSIAH